MTGILTALAPRQPSSRPAMMIVATAVLFNAALALVNANVLPISSAAVAAAELAIDAAAIIVSLRRPHPLQRRWLMLIIVLVVINVSNSVGNGNFDPKFLRDVMIIPIFALLGVTADRDTIVRLVVWLQVIVLIFMVYEAISPEGFGRVFNVLSYYVNTRGFQTDQFWSQDLETSDLFVSATRPGERFLFASLGIHRLSSIFLEPVSLGNYVVIVAMAMAALWDRISTRIRAFLAISTVMILVGCDGRFATVSIIIMVMLRIFAPSLPPYSNLVYIPLVLISATIAVVSFGISPDGDDFPSRTAGSIEDLSKMEPMGLIGYSGAHAYGVMDSGISYLVYSQSVIGAAVIWISICTGLDQKDRPSTIFSHAVTLYVGLNLLISYSVFSVKTAGLLWFAFGAMGCLGADARRSKPGADKSELPTSIGRKIPIRRALGKLK